MLIKLRKAQSTAEYALVITAVIAFLAAGQVLLKGALKRKAEQALGYYEDQGQGGAIDLGQYGSDTDIHKFEQQHYDTTVNASDYVSERITHKGGEEERIFGQTSKREGTTIEKDNVTE